MLLQQIFVVSFHADAPSFLPCLIIYYCFLKKINCFLIVVLCFISLFGSRYFSFSFIISILVGIFVCIVVVHFHVFIQGVARLLVPVVIIVIKGEDALPNITGQLMFLFKAEKEEVLMFIYMRS